MVEDQSGEEGAEDHTGEVYVDTKKLPDTLLIARAGSVENYLREIGIDPAVLTDEGEPNA